MKQYTITEHNDHEGESFSYILDLDEQTFQEIKSGLEGNPDIEIEEGTTYTTELVKTLNTKSENTYMSRYQFNEIVKPTGDFDWYYDVFYKAIGLTRI